MVTLQCHGCGKAFNLAYASMAIRRKYCSQSCVPHKTLQKSSGHLLKQCQMCGVEFLVWHCQKNRKVCGVFCRGRLRAQTERAALQKRECVVCGKEFLIAKSGKRFSRHARTSSSRFCSRKCSNLTKQPNGRRCRELQPEVAAYLAGFWDGEGSIMLIGRSDSGSIGVRSTITNTSYDVLTWTAEVCGIGTVQRKPRKATHHKPTWFWQIHGEGAESFLQQLIPYLKVKREQARLALAFQARLRDPSMKADRIWQEDWRQQMKALNARGITKTIAQ